jgi:hypothetical protein
MLVPQETAFPRARPMLGAMNWPQRAGSDTVGDRFWIDHVIYAVPDLQQAVADIEKRFGVQAGEGGKHPGQGTHNRLLALDPSDVPGGHSPRSRAARTVRSAPLRVDAVTRAAVVGWALATDDIAAAPTTARAKGFDPGDVVDGHGVTPTGRLLHWRLTPKLAWIRRPP